MKRIVGIVFLLILAGGAGFAVAFFFFNQGEREPGSATASNEPAILYWVAPMDPNYRRDKPGKSPMGMDLVPVYADDVPTDEDVILIDPHVVHNLGVRTEPVQRSPLQRKIRTVGYVEYDENALHHVHTRVEGWIEKLSVKAKGDPIQADQVLFEIYSPTLVNAQNEYLMALNRSSESMVEASEDRLLALGLTEAQIVELAESEETHERVKVHAKSDGVVAMLGVREGIYITPSTHTMSIAEPDQLWIVAEILERQSGLVTVGHEAIVELDAFPGTELKGTVNYIYPELDPDTRSLKVRLTLQNDAPTLRPNMYARIAISIPGAEPVFHIPMAALIRGGPSDRVVLKVGDGRYRSVPVEVGIQTEQRVQIRRGLELGDEVVVSGQFMIDSESNIEAALARFNETEETSSPAVERATIGAIVRRLIPDQSKVRVKHDAVPQWKWMSMTMNMQVENGELLENIEVDQEVDLVVEKREEGYIIVDIQPTSTTESEDSD